MYFGNVITAMITPFDRSGQLDLDKAVELANYLADNGSDSILLTGTTGESPTLTNQEEISLYDAVIKGLSGKAKVIAGTGSNCTRTAIEYTQKAQKIGVDGALIVSPYYNKPSQDGLYAHFKAIAENTELPLIIYNIPGRTSVNILPETIKKISELKNYVAIKEASGDLSQIKKVIELVAPEFLVYSGDDKLTLEILKLGGVGVVSVASHLIGQQIQQIINAFRQSDLSKAQELDSYYQDLYSAMFITTNPVPVKSALNMQGKEVGSVRLPLVEMNDVQSEQLLNTLKRYNLV